MARYIALDVHKGYIYAGEWLPEEKTKRHFRVANTPDGWSQLLQRLDATCHVAVEVTGNALELPPYYPSSAIRPWFSSRAAGEPWPRFHVCLTGR